MPRWRLWRTRPRVLLVALLVVAALQGLRAGDPPAPVEYRITIPDPASHQLAVDVLVTDVPAGPVSLRFSRSSPGRYARHNFIGQVTDLRVQDASGRALRVTGPDEQGWTVPTHGGSMRVSYRVRGERLDGTYLAVDRTHAHINMPAALVWVRGFETRPARVRVTPPSGSGWRVATQLLPTAEADTFLAPNLQYLMDSPIEVSAFATRTFTVRRGDRTARFRLALHDGGTAADADLYARDLEAITGEAAAVFGALPAFESPDYTFIADFLPSALGDGMEHRNSTVLTSAASIGSARRSLDEKAAHEVFHAWNIERIRPRSLEPFAFDGENVSGELWLGEGVTNYYGKLLLVRAGLARLQDVMRVFGDSVERVTSSPGRRSRSVVEMSRLAVRMDGASPEARAPYEGQFLSYYTWGEAIGLALDLELRNRSNHAVSLDTVMQRLWDEFGAVAGQPGLVPRPYEEADVERILGAVAGDAAFARSFLDRFVRGTDVPAFAVLLAPAGFTVARVPDRDSATAGAERLAIVPVEARGERLTAEQREFRRRWTAPRR